MANQAQQPFESIRIVGGLISSKVLQDARQYNLPGQGKADYGIEPSLAFNDELGRYWVIARSRWQEFQQQVQREDLDQRHITIDDWLLPLLSRVFGYQVAARTEKYTLGEREFPITHEAFDGAVPMVLCGADQDLDKSDSHYGQEGRRRSPMGLAQEYLNAESSCLWALVSNGQVLRVLRDNPAMTRPAYIEIDFARMFDEDNYADFATLWLLLHASRLTPREERPEQCWLEQWREQGHHEGERALDKLRYGVADALRQLGTGFLAHPDNSELRRKIRDDELSTEVYFQQVLRLVYRMLFLLTAEDRDIALLPQEYEGENYRNARQLYQAGYSLAVLRERARLRRHYDHHTDAWQQLCVTFEGFANGQPLLAQPALGGLFATDQCPDLASSLIENRYLYSAVYNLSYFEHNHILSRINYRDMDTEEFGSVYESLLELIPQIHPDGKWRFSFVGDAEDETSASGHSRKLSGSYYTPDSLVQELIKSTLEPVITDRLVANPQNPRTALLGITVCDPACGSGHFLLAAARRLATELAQIDAGSDQATENHYRHALRDVVRHCIFGVDLNPMAVELCKTGLWLESIEPGKPLSFLDAHIQCGNALVGLVTEKAIEAGIESEAFKAQGLDDRDICAQLKSQNSAFASRIAISKKTFHELDFNQDGHEESSIADVETKHRQWRKFLNSENYIQLSLLESLYTAAYFSEKTSANSGEISTNAHIDLAISEGFSSVPSPVVDYSKSLERKFSFFHWHLRFPSVFKVGGFDLVLGNPPWDVVKKEENDSFSDSEHDRLKRWFGTGLFDIAKGKKDLYKLFLTRSTEITNKNGAVGLIIPVGVFIEDKPLPLRKHLLENGQIDRLSIYQNNKKKFFPSVHASTIFCALSYSRHSRGRISYSTIAKYGEESRQTFFYGKNSEMLSKDLTVVLMHNSIHMDIYQKILKNSSQHKELKYRVTAEFHASSDKKDISKERQYADDWKILKNDGIHQFNPDYGPPNGYISSSSVRDKVNSKKFPEAYFSDPKKERLVFRDIARAEDSRTLIACLLPPGYVSSYDTPMIISEDESNPDAVKFYLGYLNALVVDFLVRPHVDKHIKGYILNRVTIPKYDPQCSVMRSVSKNAENLNNQRDNSYGESRAEIDACVAHILNVKPDEFKEISQSFSALLRSKLIDEKYISRVCNRIYELHQNNVK